MARESPHFQACGNNSARPRKYCVVNSIATPICLMMSASTEPAATLSDLYRADGSATYSQNGYTVIGSVNGPLEVQRRDELPEEAVVDVIVRPAAGVGGVRERHLESVLQSTLRQIILVHNFPRTLIQVTLQISSTPENDTESSKPNQSSSSLPLLPVLFQTSMLALLSAAIPLATTLSSTLLVIEGGGPEVNIIENPTISEIQQAESNHVLTFTSHGELLVAESEGAFDMDQWDRVFEHANRLCCGTAAAADEDAMIDEGEDAGGKLMQFLRSTLEEKVTSDLLWRK